MNRQFDVVVFGATGFTGRLVAEYLLRHFGVNDSLNWAIAGRSHTRLAEVCAELGTDVPLLIADTSDVSSLRSMVSQTSVVCTTVGPYALYGTDLVRLCAESGTHYCDLTGEVPWMHEMINRFDTTAQASGARIVHCCGFDSIPSDLGVWFLQQEMMSRHGRFADTVKCRIGDTRGGASGGTVASLVNVAEAAGNKAGVAEILADPYALNPVNTAPCGDRPDNNRAHFDDDFDEWTAPFLMSSINTRVVRRTHALTGNRWSPDFRYDEAMLTGSGFGGRLRAQFVSFGLAMLFLCAALAPTRTLLKRLAPNPGEGPSRELIESGYFSYEMRGIISSDRSLDCRIAVTGDRDPGYGATSGMLAESAVSLARDELDSPPGISTPAFALGVNLLERLEQRAGMRFTILQ